MVREGRAGWKLQNGRKVMGEDEKTCAGCKHQFIRCDDCGYCKRDPDLVDNFEAADTEDGE